MSEKYVITISREFASMGRTIAQQMAEILHIPFYDRDIVEAAAKNLNMRVPEVSNLEEKANRYIYRSLPLGNGTSDIQDKIFEAQREVILEYTKISSCIIVGRCADYILQDRPNVMSVHIYSSYEHKYNNCIHNLMMSPKEAEKMIKQVDQARKAYHLNYAKYAPDDIHHRDMLIDSSFLGVEGTAQFLAELAKKRFGV